MNIEKIKSELFRLLSGEKESLYSSETYEDKICHNTKYKIYNDYYLNIRNNSSFEYIFNLKNQINDEASKLEKEYKALLKKYEKETLTVEKNAMVDKINLYVYQIDAYNIVYNVISKYLKNNNGNSINYSNNVIGLINNIKREKDSERKNKLEEELYQLIEERRVRLSAKTDSYIIKEICELESLELRIADAEDKIKTYKVSRKPFLSGLKSAINAINEYHFLDYKKSKHYKGDPNRSEEENKEGFKRIYSSYVNIYYSLITSLFKENYHMIGKDNKISTDDLINYLTIYNLDGNYEVFRSKNRNILIGTSEINKTDYDSKIELLTKAINYLIEECANKIKDNQIEVTDFKSDKKDLTKQRDFKIGEIESIISEERAHARN